MIEEPLPTNPKREHGVRRPLAYHTGRLFGVSLLVQTGQTLEGGVTTTAGEPLPNGSNGSDQSGRRLPNARARNVGGLGGLTGNT